MCLWASDSLNYEAFPKLPRSAVLWAFTGGTYLLHEAGGHFSRGHGKKGFLALALLSSSTEKYGRCLRPPPEMDLK